MSVDVGALGAQSRNSPIVFVVALRKDTFSAYPTEVILDEDLFQLPFADISLDRRAELRKDTKLLEREWRDSASLLLLVAGKNNVLVRPEGGLHWRSPTELSSELPEDAIFLGVTESEESLFALADVDPSLMGSHEEAVFCSLRDIALSLDAFEQSAAALAVALATWHQQAPYCPHCGQLTRPSEAGHVRRCAGCDATIFPRSDAAVIMLVSDGDRCVLGRRIGSANGRWSTLAGFVEAGESPEAALCREVFEEVGLRVDGLRYRGSQPWPFPSSLMLAYEAHAPYGDLRGNEEHHEVRWFTREELRRGYADGSLGVPSTLSAGGHLIRDWLERGVDN